MAPTTTAAGGTDEQGLPTSGASTPGENAAGLQVTTTTAAPTPTTAPATTGTTATTAPSAEPSAGECTGVEDTTRLGDDGLPVRLTEEGVDAVPPGRACNTVVLAERDPDGVIITRYLLGPTALTGDALSGASAALDQTGVGWQVLPTFRGGEDGIDKFNAVAAECFSAAPTCPTQQLAIVLDTDVISAPTIQTDTFQRDEVQITGDFDEAEAKDLALVLEYGALPVELEPPADPDGLGHPRRGLAAGRAHRRPGRPGPDRDLHGRLLPPAGVGGRGQPHPGVRPGVGR